MTKRIGRICKPAILMTLVLMLIAAVSGMGHANAALIRESQVTITDAGRFTQHCDVARLPDSKKAIEDMGYTHIRVMISAIIWEQDDGYQHIFIYDRAEVEKAAMLAPEFRWEHSKGKIDPNMKTMYCQVDIPIGNLTHNEIILRYGASGYGADTYYIKNVIVNFSYVKKPVS